MRLGVFLLFLVFALAMASSPAVAQVPSAPSVLKPDKEAEKAAKEAEKAAKKAAKEAEKAAKKAAKEAEKAAKKAAKEAEKAARDDDDHGPGDDDEPGDAGDVDGPQGPTAGGAGGGPTAGDSGGGGTEGHNTGGPTRSTGNADDGQSSTVSNPGCTEGCSSPQDVAAGDQGDSILAAAGAAGKPGVVESQAFSYSEPARGASPGVLALFVLMLLGLLIGLGGGLMALRGRLSSSS
jgi:hypothetical protein